MIGHLSSNGVRGRSVDAMMARTREEGFGQFDLRELGHAFDDALSACWLSACVAAATLDHRLGEHDRDDTQYTHMSGSGRTNHVGRQHCAQSTAPLVERAW